MYLATFGNGFVLYDDTTLITQNWAMQIFSVSTVLHVFTSYDPELYDPLTLFMYQVIHLLFGFQPAAFHAVSLLLHLANALLIGWITWQLFERKWITILCVALFALHPLQSEAVLWAAALKDVLSSFFFLLSLGLYLLWRRHMHASSYIWSIICFALGLFAKVSVVPLPFVLLLVDHVQGRRLTRETWIEKWPYFALAFAFVLIALGGKSGGLAQLGLASLFLLGIKSVAFYLLHLVWPLHFSVVYPQPTAITIASPEFWLPLCVFLILIAISIFMWKRRPLVSISIAFYLLMLVPSFASAYKNGFVLFASDRYAYLAVIGAFLLIAFLIDRLTARVPRASIPVGIICIALLLALSAQTLIQTNVWKNTATLFRHADMLYPDSALAQNNLGAAETDTGAALADYRKAIELDPSYLLPYQNIAHIDVSQGNFADMKAISESGVTMFNRKTVIGNDDLSFLFSYAEYLDEQGQSDRALALFKDAVAKAPDSAEAHFNLGLKEEKYGNTDAALADYETAASIGSDDPRLYYRLASLASSKGLLQEAVNALRQTLTIDPSYPNAASHLADIEQLQRQQSP
ncbi:MAG TPA: tetratricopeptide repeat protein [Candidatus Peribacteraceae bacterium]|nr:tetratricopeptide repeat protein [Candidatus Peribacteraceae bacterium]